MITLSPMITVRIPSWRKRTLMWSIGRKIGRTTYIVRVHFSKTSRETMSDKIKRMLKNEIQQM